MRPVHVRIDRLTVEIDDERRADEVERTLRRAVALLASRLAETPGPLDAQVPSRALDLVELEPVDADWLAGAGAAAWLADRLYGHLWGETR
jgi:hypothetical protein